jgi:hypothetical protein
MREELAAIKALGSPSPSPIASETSSAREATKAQAREHFERALGSRAAPSVGDRAVGLSRAREAWRYSDGTFMPDAKTQAAIEDCELQ